MNADHELLKDFASRTQRAAPERPQITMPPASAQGGSVAMMPREQRITPPEMPGVAMPERPERPDIAMPERGLPVPSPAMPTFAAKERGAAQSRGVDVGVGKRDQHGDLLREIRDLLGRDNVADPKRPFSRMPEDNRASRSQKPFGHLLYR